MEGNCLCLKLVIFFAVKALGHRPARERGGAVSMPNRARQHSAVLAVLTHVGHPRPTLLCYCPATPYQPTFPCCPANLSRGLNPKPIHSCAEQMQHGLRLC